MADSPPHIGPAFPCPRCRPGPCTCSTASNMEIDATDNDGSIGGHVHQSSSALRGSSSAHDSSSALRGSSSVHDSSSALRGSSSSTPIRDLGPNFKPYSSSRDSPYDDEPVDTSSAAFFDTFDSNGVPIRLPVFRRNRTRSSRGHHSVLSTTPPPPSSGSSSSSTSSHGLPHSSSFGSTSTACSTGGQRGHLVSYEAAAHAAGDSSAARALLAGAPPAAVGPVSKGRCEHCGDKPMLYQNCVREPDQSMRYFCSKICGLAYEHAHRGSIFFERQEMRRADASAVIIASQINLGRQQRATSSSAAAAVPSSVDAPGKPPGLLVPPAGVPLYRYIFFEICKAYPATRHYFLHGPEPMQQKIFCLKQHLKKNVRKMELLQLKGIYDPFTAHCARDGCPAPPEMLEFGHGNNPLVGLADGDRPKAANISELKSHAALHQSEEANYVSLVCTQCNALARDARGEAVDRWLRIVESCGEGPSEEALAAACKADGMGPLEILVGLYKLRCGCQDPNCPYQIYDKTTEHGRRLRMPPGYDCASGDEAEENPWRISSRIYGRADDTFEEESEEGKEKERLQGTASKITEDDVRYDALREEQEAVVAAAGTTTASSSSSSSSSSSTTTTTSSSSKLPARPVTSDVASYRPTQAQLQAHGVRLNDSCFFPTGPRRGQVKNVSTLARAGDALLMRLKREQAPSFAAVLDTLNEVVTAMLESRTVLHAACHRVADARRYDLSTIVSVEWPRVLKLFDWPHTFEGMTAEKGVLAGGGVHAPCEYCCRCKNRRKPCGNCTGGHLMRCAYAVRAHKVGEKQMLRELEKGRLGCHKNEEKARDCGYRCCECIGLDDWCTNCTSGYEYKRCKARSDVVIPADIADDPVAVTIFVQEIISRHNASEEYNERVKDPANHKPIGPRGALVVVDDSNNILHYTHQGPPVGSGEKKKLNGYFTCTCCRCRGLAKMCHSKCSSTKCRHVRGTKTTLEAFARAKVAEVVA